METLLKFASVIFIVWLITLIITGCTISFDWRGITEQDQNTKQYTKKN